MDEVDKLRDDAAEQYSESKYKMMNGLGVQVKTAMDDFKAGWDARDKMDNEALKGAVEALTFIRAEARRQSKETLSDYYSDFYNKSDEALAKIKSLRRLE